MNLFRKMKNRLSLGKQQIQEEPKKKESWESAKRWYMERFEKDVRLQELYPQSYLRLQKELSTEEWSVLKPLIDKQMKIEGRKEKLLAHLDENEELKKQYEDIYAQLPTAVSAEELERYEGILKDYEDRRTEHNQWLAYLQSFPTLKKKYAREYEMLQTDLSKEEFKAVVATLNYEILLLQCLFRQYNVYVKETTEANYATGKVEKLYNGFIGHEELMRKYPEETEELIKYYGPEFDEFFFEKDGKPKYVDIMVLYDERVNLRFQDMLFFRGFIERNHVFEECVITDREYTVISNKLRTYVPDGAIRGIAGTYTGYTLSYENFLKVKEQYPEDVAFHASQEKVADEIWRFIDKVHPYLEQREIHYMV